MKKHRPKSRPTARSPRSSEARRPAAGRAPRGGSRRPNANEAASGPRLRRDDGASSGPQRFKGTDAAPRQSAAPDRNAPAEPAPAAMRYDDPYQRVQRPRARPSSPQPPAGRDTPGARRPPGRGFSVMLDPDVARVFRGDASVNKALRLVMQLMQVVQGPPSAARGEGRIAGTAPVRRGYQGSDAARGFARAPRFSDDDAE